ncbi:MAG: MOSC domain-containing protein, partial [Acidimicrobiales bacterium]
RWWAVKGVDGKLGSGKTTRHFRRMPGLLSMSSFIDEDDVTWVRFGDGHVRRADDPKTACLVGDVVGEDVTLAEEEGTPHFDDAPLHLVTTSSLAWLAERRPTDQIDRRRFRPNLVIETDGAGLTEDGWLGRQLQIGETTVAIDMQTERCVMTTLAQGGLGVARGILTDLHRANASCLGVYAHVVSEGTIHIGDQVDADTARRS